MLRLCFIFFFSFLALETFSSNIQSIFIDSVSFLSNNTNGSFMYPFQNLSQGLNLVNDIIDNDADDIEINVFLKYYPEKEKSIYNYSDFIYMDMRNISKLSFCSYSYSDVYIPEKCESKETPQSASMLFLPDNKTEYSQEFLVFISHGQISFSNVRIDLDFENRLIMTIFELYWMNVSIFNCSLNIAKIGGNFNADLNQNLIFFSLINSNLLANFSTMFNDQGIDNNIYDIPSQFTLFFCKYLENDIEYSDTFLILLDFCLINIHDDKKIIKFMRIIELYGNEKVSLLFSNNKFIDYPNSQILLNNDLNDDLNEDFHCGYDNQVYLFSIKISGTFMSAFMSNQIESYEFNKDCYYKSFRFEIMQTNELAFYNESYTNLIIYMVFSQIQTIYLNSVQINTNGTENEQRKYVDDNYLLLYVNDYAVFLMDTFVVYNYAISKSILIEFEPTEFGNYTLLQNLVLDKASGTIYFLFEPNIYLKSFDYDKKIDLSDCSFTELSNAGLIFSGLIATSITYIKMERCFFYNITNDDFQMHMKSIYYLPIPLIFFDSLTAREITLHTIVFIKINSFVGDFINIILNTSPGVLNLNEILINEINSKDIMCFIIIQASCDSLTDIYLSDIVFDTIIIKNNLISIRSFNADDEQEVVVGDIISSPLLYLKNISVYNFNQSNYDSFNINEWDFNIDYVFYFFYPKIYLYNIMISDSNITFRDHNIVLSGSQLILIDNFIVKDLKIKYQKTNSYKLSSVGHFIHFMSSWNSVLTININSIYFRNIHLYHKEYTATLSCGKYQFFLLVYSIKNAFISLRNSYFEHIIGNCQLLNIFAFSDEFIEENISNQSSFLLVNRTIFQNISGFMGTVFYCDKGAALFSNNVFTENFAYNGGGVFFIGPLCNLYINASYFIDNLSKYGRILAIDSNLDNIMNDYSQFYLKNNTIIESSMNYSKNSTGLFFLLNLDSFIYNCSFEEKFSPFKFWWKCKSLIKSALNSFHFNFAEYLIINSSYLLNISMDSNNFTKYKKLIDISLSNSIEANHNKSIEFDFSFPFSLSIAFNKSFVQSYSSKTTEEQNLYILKNQSIEKLNAKQFSFIAYSNTYNDNVRCPKNKCFFPFVVINMNECNLGNIFDLDNPNSRCSQCSQSYVLPFQADSGQCLPCPVFANCDNGVIQPKEGFWRSGNMTDKIYYCSGDLNSCLGGFASECEKGYQGALCKACDINNGYYHGTLGSCGKCNSSIGLEIFFFCLEFLIFLAIEVYVVYSDSSCLIEHEKNNFGEIQEKYSKKDQISRLGNILFTYLQIVSLLEFFGVDLPDEIFFFAEFFVNPNNGLMYSQYCLVNYLNFDIPLVYLNLIVYILASVLRLFLLVLIWNLIGNSRTRKISRSILEEKNTFVNLFPETKINEPFQSVAGEFKNKTELNYSSLSFIGWFLIENIIVLREVFLLFCVKIDGKKYIEKDFNYQCDNDYYNIYLPYLIYPVIILYGSIIPLYIYGSVIYNRNNLKNHEVLKKFGPLYLAVKPKYFYWPFVNYLLKFSIIIIGVFGSVDPVKIVALLIVLIFYSIFLYLIQPYIFHNLNRLEIISCWIFIVTLTFTQTQILSNIYVSLKYLNYEQKDLSWISVMGYYVVLSLNFGFAGFLAIRILILASQRVHRYLIKFYEYFCSFSQ